MRKPTLLVSVAVQERTNESVCIFAGGDDHTEQTPPWGSSLPDAPREARVDPNVTSRSGEQQQERQTQQQQEQEQQQQQQQQLVQGQEPQRQAQQEQEPPGHRQREQEQQVAQPSAALSGQLRLQAGAQGPGQAQGHGKGHHGADLAGSARSRDMVTGVVGLPGVQAALARHKAGLLFLTGQVGDWRDRLASHVKHERRLGVLAKQETA